MVALTQKYIQNKQIHVELKFFKWQRSSKNDSGCLLL